MIIYKFKNYSYSTDDLFFDRVCEVKGVELYPVKARDYEERFNWPASQAKTLAKMAPTEELLSELGKNFSKEIDKRSMYWVLGHDLRDMKMAAEHASGIVRSVRVLGGSHFKREAGIKVYQSFEGSIALLKQNLKDSNNLESFYIKLYCLYIFHKVLDILNFLQLLLSTSSIFHIFLRLPLLLLR